MVTDWEDKCWRKRKDNRENDLEFLKNIHKSGKEGYPYFKQFLKVLKMKNSKREFVPFRYGSLYKDGDIALKRSDVAKVFNPDYILFIFDSDKKLLQCILVEEQHSRWCEVKESKISDYSLKGRIIENLIYFYGRESNTENIVEYLKKLREMGVEKLDLYILHTDKVNDKRYCILNDDFLRMIYERDDFVYRYPSADFPKGKKCIKFYENEVEWKNYDMNKWF